MASYVFEARDAQGRAQAGELAAETPSALAAELRGRGWIVLKVEPGRAERGPGEGAFRLRLGGLLPATRFDVEVGLSQIASMLRSGLTLLSALRTAAEQARRPAMAAVWTKVAERIQEGESLAGALAEHPRLFAPTVLQLVRVGEQSGVLDVVLVRGAEHLERSRNLRSLFLSALLYPSIVFFLALGVAAFMVIHVIPKLQKFLGGLGRRLPPLTQALLDSAAWLNAWLPFLVVGLLAGLAAIWTFYRWPPGRLLLDRMALRVPIFGRLLRLSASAVFARGMGILVESGVTQLEALRTVEGLLQNRFLGRILERAREAVMQGSSLSGPLAQSGQFTPMLHRMVAVGESTGSLDRVLAEVARFHESELQGAVRRLSILVEPAIIVFVGGIVGFVYLAFFTAIFSLAGGR